MRATLALLLNWAALLEALSLRGTFSDGVSCFSGALNDAHCCSMRDGRSGLYGGHACLPCKSGVNCGGQFNQCEPASYYLDQSSGYSDAGSCEPGSEASERVMTSGVSCQDITSVQHCCAAREGNMASAYYGTPCVTTLSNSVFGCAAYPSVSPSIVADCSPQELPPSQPPLPPSDDSTERDFLLYIVLTLVAGFLCIPLLYILHKVRGRKGANRAVVHHAPEPEAHEVAAMHARCKAEDERHVCTFYFVAAEYVRTSREKTLPSFKQLARIRGAISEKTISRHEAFRALHSDTCLAVSHRWMEVGQPDAEGQQAAAVRDYLSEHPEIQWVWYDFWCMPQGERTKLEKIEFSHMLRNVNLLYLGMRVLILLDLSYMSRFWTQFEAWLSMQQCTTRGLVPAPDVGRRCKDPHCCGRDLPPHSLQTLSLTSVDRRCVCVIKTCANKW